MKISMFPRDMKGNEYIAIIREGLAGNGVEVADFSILDTALGDRGIAAMHMQMMETMLFLKPYRFSDALALAWMVAFTRHVRKLRDAGRHFVWTAHNIVPHDGLPARFPRTWDYWRNTTTALVDRVVALSEESAAEVRAAWPSLRNAEYHVIPHPHYRGVYKSRRPRGEQRRLLGLPEGALVFGSIGTVRPYKNLVDLAESARRVLRPSDRLLIAGHCYNATLDGEIRAAIGGDERIVYVPKDLDNHEYASIMGCLDYAVLNYRKILNSGSIFASLSLDVPTIAPNMGSITSAAREVGPEWVVTFEGSVAEPMAAVVTRDGARPAGRPDLSLYEPSRIGALHAACYR